jgi:hypothetical protein
VWTAPPLTSRLFVLAAFFVAAAALLTFIHAAVLAVLLFSGVALMTTSLLALARVASRRFLRLATLLTGTCTSAAFFHTLIAITIVCHI